MLELISTEAAIIACHGPAAVLDGLSVAPAAFRIRIAPDELWLLADRTARADLFGAARAHLTQGLVVDQTDGWSIWTVRGAPGREILARLMLAEVGGNGLELVQGAIAGVAGKVLAVRDTFHLFVPAPLGHHLRDRIVAVGADLEVRQGAVESFRLAVEEAASC